MNELKFDYEVWSSNDGEEISCGLSNIVKQGIFDENAIMLFSFKASTYEEVWRFII